VEAIYGSPIAAGKSIDLNTFTWFYTYQNVWTRPCTLDSCDDEACDDFGSDCCSPGSAPRKCKHGKVPTNLTGACWGHANARFTCVAPGADYAAIRLNDAKNAVPPALLSSDSACLTVCEVGLATPTYDGTMWVGRGVAASAAFRDVGFFVRRDAAFVDPSVMRRCDRLEVGHLLTSYKGGEKGVSWFFHTIGSGVWLDCHNLPTSGRVAAYWSRQDFQRHEHEEWEDDEYFPQRWMRQHHVSMIILTRADFKQYGFSGGNPRTEIIVLHKESWTTEAQHGGTHGVCLQGQINIHTYSGYDGRGHCDCQPIQRGKSRFLHCG